MMTWFDERGSRRPLYRDREEAGAVLADNLMRYRGAHPVILGIPRGGVVCAAEVAKRLGAPLDVLVTRKIGAPYSSELAIGAVSASGETYLDRAAMEQLLVSPEYALAAVPRERAIAERKEQLYRVGRPRVALRHRTAIVVDDGLATGATMRVAVHAVRGERPARIVVAAPVGATETCEALRAEADAVVCPHELADFRAVGLCYLDFEPTTDEAVRELMRDATFGTPRSPAAAASRA